MSAAPRHADARIARIVDLFEQFTPADVTRLGDFYAVDARFKDPFNDVHGVAQVQRIFSHMFDALDEPRFVVHDILVQGDQCFLSWYFVFRFRRFSRELQTVHGSSHLMLAADGCIAAHRDYWDAAEELYEKLPLIGALMRWLRRRANG
ncbi:MAG TPA: nuclear transport factor 2 family protein [Casimicrobiaceae bacterium]